MDRIYLDHSATTPIRPEVFKAMEPYLREAYGNAGSIHSFGRESREAIDAARHHVAALIHADPREIVFTSGGTESDNAALKGILAAARRPNPNIVTTAIEHHAVLHTARHLTEHDGVEVRLLQPNRDGVVDPAQLSALLDENTALVSVMHANNETGAIQPIEEIAAICEARGVPFHTDAVQSAGKLPINVEKTPIGMLALSAHKLYAPKGIGAWYVNAKIHVVPQTVGGAQERARRAGTENVAGIVALGKACELARAEMAPESIRLQKLRDRLELGILETVPGTYRNGPADARLPHIANIGFRGVEGESIILGLDTHGIAVSSGSACASGSLEPSHVLLAMGLSDDEARSAVRFSLGKANNEAQIDFTLATVRDLVKRLRSTPNLR